MEECGRHDRAHTTTDEVAGERQRGGGPIDVQGGVGMGSGTRGQKEQQRGRVRGVLQKRVDGAR